jgi:hypothetical protein
VIDFRLCALIGNALATYMFELLMVLEARTCAMKRPHLLKAIPGCRSVVVFAGFLWAASIAFAGPGQTRTSTKANAATPPQTEVQAAQNKLKNTAAKSGVWHHFGESDNAPVAGQSQPGVWHTFRPNRGTPTVLPDETASRQSFGANRLANLGKL